MCSISVISVRSENGLNAESKSITCPFLNSFIDFPNCRVNRNNELLSYVPSQGTTLFGALHCKYFSKYFYGNRE